MVLIATVGVCLIGTVLLYLFFEKTRVDAFSKLPGPKGLPLIGVLLDFEAANFVRKWEEWAWKYGPIYSFKILWKRFIIISDMAALQDMLKSRPSTFNRGIEIETIFKDLNIHALFSEDGEEWRRSRQLVTPAFSTARVLDMRSCIVRHTLNLRKALLETSNKQRELLSQSLKPPGFHYNWEKVGKPDVLPQFQKTALSIVMETAFSWGNEGLISEELTSKIGVLFEVIGNRLVSPVPWYKIWKTKQDAVAEQTINELFSIIDKIYDKMDEEESKLKSSYDAKNNNEDDKSSVTKRTLLHSLILARQKEIRDPKVKEMSKEKIKGNILQVMVAGYETTAATLEWTLYFLARYPLVQRKLQEEVDSVLGHIKDWDSEETGAFLETLDLSYFPYTLNVLHECMRLKPVAPGLPASNSKTVTILGHEIPKGTNLAYLTRLTSLSSCETPNPTVFDPDRWAGAATTGSLYDIKSLADSDSEEAYKTLINNTFFFGGGSRVCPGRHLATLEMIFILTVAVSSLFDVQEFPMPPGEENVEELSKFTQISKNFHPILKTRKTVSK